MSIDWPAGFDRTPKRERVPKHSFRVSLSTAFDELEKELAQLDVENYRYSFDAQQRQRDNRPYSQASPDDPSFVLRFTREGEQYAIGCDAYTRLRDNVRAVGLYVREKRKMENRPVTTGESEFANARLPGGEGKEPIAVHPSKEPHEILEVAPNASPAVVEAAYKEKVKETHPDRGGTREEFQAVQDAKEKLLKEGSE